MGLFSSSYKYYAFAGSADLFEEEDRPETIKSNIVQSITTEGGLGMADAIKFGLQTDLYARAKSMISYAKKEDGYFFGFPETNQNILNISVSMLRPFIEADAGGPIDFRTLGWNPWSNLDIQNFFVEKAINENYTNPTYFPWDGTLGLPIDTNWSPVDDTVEIPVVIDNPDPTPDEYAVSDNQFGLVKSGDSFQVSFPYSGGDWNVAQPFDMSAYNVEGTWITVRYRMAGGGDQYLYWAYLVGSGDNPALEAEIEAEAVNLQYLPIAVMMHDKVWFDESGNQEWEDTLDRLLRDLAMDPYEIKEDFLKQQEEDDASGDSDKSNAETWDFFIHFNIPHKTMDRGGREYLFYFWDFLRRRSSWTTKDQFETWINGGQFGEQPHSTLSVEEGVEYTGYIARYAWSYIDRVDLAGEFTPPGWTEPLKSRRMWSETYEFGSANYTEGLDIVYGPGNYVVPASIGEEQEGAYTVVTRAHEDGTHSHIIMMAPSMEYQINTSQDPVGVGPGGYVDYRYRFVDCELFPEDPEQESEFRWPVHIASIKEVSAVRREAALSDGLCSTVFLVEVVKVKWYQKGFFKWLIIIIAVILIVLSILFPGFLAAASFLLASALGGGLLAFYIIYTILMFAVGWIITTAGQLIGGTWGTVFAVVGMIIVGARGGLNGAPGGAGFNISVQGANGFASAVSLINTTYPYINGGLQIYQAFALDALQDDMEDFMKSAREKYDQLRDAWDMLGDPTGNINPINLTARAQDWYIESPSQFYSRSLNANPGVMSYDLINNFVNMSTTLPETPGDPNIVDVVFEQFAAQRGQV